VASASKIESTPRVLQVVSSDAFAGIERHVLSLTRTLRALGCAAELACPPSAARLRAEAWASGIPVVPASSSRPRFWPEALLREVMSRPAAAIHVHDGRAALGGAALSLVTGGPLVRTQHFLRTASMERGGWRGQASLAAHRQLNRRLDGYVAVSQCVAVAGRERHETGRASVVVIPPAIDLPSADAVAQARIDRRRIAHPVVAFAGRLEPERHLDVLLNAIPIVLARIPECRFVLAGSGSAEGQLRALATRLGIDQVIAWAGWVRDTYAVLGGAHAYVNTWPDEAFGMAMAEAMALALPVIAVDAGANTEMVEHGVTGNLVAQDEPAALAQAIVDVVGDRDRAVAMGEAARRTALSRYGAERTALSTIAFYRQVEQRASS
jgi:glycosyltransferase involved in cell wall biosynthesis